MSEEIRCPRCQSTSVRVNQENISPVKPADEYSIARLSGVVTKWWYSKTNSNAVCLVCGNRFNPVEVHLKVVGKSNMKANEWKDQFMVAYKAGDTDLATALARKERTQLLEEEGLEGVFKRISKEKETKKRAMLIGMAILFVIVLVISLILIRILRN